MANARILIVDDDRDVRGSLEYLLRAAGLSAHSAASAEAALAFVSAGRTPDVVVADFHLPGADGLDLLTRLRERCPEVPFILVTGDAQRPIAERALELGAADFLAKPLNDAELLFRLRRLLDAERLRRENRALKDQLGSHEGLAGLIGRSPAMQRIFGIVSAVAETRATLLIHGESGTGKSMLARALHLLSDRKDGPFVELACGALPEELIESELFGHVRGAFTGAIADRRGKIEAANGGTLFLDEIAVASPALQIKLLRVLQERAFERVGSTETVRSDLRLVLATNRDLETMVARGEFREDLFYRINVVTVDLPPLRERAGDIPALARHFLARFSAEHRRPERPFGDEVLPALGRYAWPGNVRQLENAVERAVVLCSGPKITLSDFPPAIRTVESVATTPTAASLELRAAMDPHEKDHLRRVLVLTRGNRCQAADILGINRSTLFNKMRKHALLDEDFGVSS